MKCAGEAGWGPLVDRILSQAIQQADLVALTFLNDDGATEVGLTYRQLDFRAKALAIRLAAAGAQDQRVLIALPYGIEYVVGLLACFYAGAVAVPAYPPRRRNVARLLGIVADCGARFGLMQWPHREWFSEQALRHPALHPDALRLQYVDVEDVDRVGATDWQPLLRSPHSVALLQYPSSPASAPKGVMLTQENFIANVDGLIARTGKRADDRVVCCLPPFHEMGLISGILAPLCHGIPTVLMSPLAFQRRPLKWLEAISRYKGTISGGSDFAYDLCVRRLAASEKLVTLDLSGWRIAFCGAERIPAHTLERFAQAMAPAGFGTQALTPCYGLAESTVCVSFGHPGQGWTALTLDHAALREGQVVEVPASHSGVVLLGCGEPLLGCELQIVDAETQEVSGPDQVGEIWIRGHSVGAGYWGKAALAGGQAGAAYSRTGDLGFVHKGQLFVAGHSKELLIFRGVKYFPEEIEIRVSACLPDAQTPVIAVFSVDRDGDALLRVVCELDAALQSQGSALSATIKDVIFTEYEIAVADVVWVAPGAIPRTSSGNVQRSACREMYLANAFKSVVSPDQMAQAAALVRAPSDDLVGRVAAVMARLLDLPHIAASDHFFSLGGHSLLVTQLVSRLRQMFSVDLGLRQAFEAATAEKLAAVIAGLPRVAPEPAIQSSAPGADKVLSFSQERMWLLNQLDPASTAYNLGCGLLLEGHVDIPALQRALACVGQRHEVLRARFPARDGAPVMVIGPTFSVPFSVHDVSSDPDPHAAAKAAAETLLNVPFDVANDTLVRFGMWHLGANAYFLGASFHHLVGDAWSLGLLLSDLLQYYDDLIAGREPRVVPTSCAYSDFAYWQRQQMQGVRLADEIAWWTHRLEGASPIEMPTDRPRSAQNTSDGSYLTMALPTGLLDELTQVGIQHGSTLFMVLLAAFEVLLARYTGSDDLVVGIPVANRNVLASEAVLGSLVNVLALRIQISPDKPFLTLLQEVRERSIDAYTHQDLPFERLVTSMRLERRVGESPLVNVMFDFQNAPVPGRSSGPYKAKPVHISPGGAQFDLTLLVTDTEWGRSAGVEFRTALFEASSMERLLRHYVAILEQVVMDASLAVERFQLVDAQERAEQLHLALPTAPGAGLMASVPECISAVVRVQPHTPAVWDDAGSLSYLELEQQSSRLAAVLAAKGAGPGQRVGVMLERNRDLVIAMLAILKTGAAYVPLDPRFPADRVRYVIEDAELRVLVTQSHWQALTGAVQADACVVLDRLSLRDGDARHAEHGAFDPHAPAYVIYTSGSTGRPKGVAVPMSALCNFLASMAHTPGLAASDRVIALTTVAFDIAGLEIWLPLVQGASVRVVTEVTATDPVALMACMRDWQPTLMQATPATWKMLLAADWQGDPALKILCGGEAMPADLATALWSRCGSLWNMYGPTETTIWSAVYRIEAGVSGRVPIGHPIDRTSLYVLDRLGNLQPRGVTGELVIGGAGVALGYFKRAELTAERFLPDPFSSEPGARMYRTGDGARLRSDGLFECLARMDDQIKLRGFRIEPGEIEALLKQDGAVQDAVVVAMGTPPDTVRLVGYYVAQSTDLQRDERLLTMLSKSLPDYMVPTALVRLDRLPQTPNGKVDRRALPKPEFGIRLPGAEYVEPRDDVQRRLVAIWQELLEMPKVGIRDNFFRMGGYSLLAIRVLARIRKEFNVILPPAVLINKPTIEQLADEIHQKNAPPPVYQYLVPFGPLEAKTRLVCVHGAGGNVFNFSALSQRLGPGRVLLGFQARGVNGKDRPFNRIEEMADAYLAELRSVQPAGPYHLAGYCGGGIVAYQMATVLRREGHEVAFLALIDCYRPGLLTQPEGRLARWRKGLREAGFQFVRETSKMWLHRNAAIIKAKSIIGCYTFFGMVIPFELRDFWLTRAFSQSESSFVPARYPGALTLMRAIDTDPELADVGPELGWTGFAPSIRTFDVPGDHHSLMDEPNVQVLAGALVECLDGLDTTRTG